MEMITREAAEQQIKEAIDDYLSCGELQEVLRAIFDEDFMVVDATEDDIEQEE